MPPKDDDNQQHDHDLLVRIDERTQNFNVLLDSIKTTMVTQKEFTPVRNITYGLVGILTTGIVLSIIGSVLN